MTERLQWVQCADFVRRFARAFRIMELDPRWPIALSEWAQQQVQDMRAAFVHTGATVRLPAPNQGMPFLGLPSPDHVGGAMADTGAMLLHVLDSGTLPTQLGYGPPDFTLLEVMEEGLKQLTEADAVAARDLASKVRRHDSATFSALPKFQYPSPPPNFDPLSVDMPKDLWRGSIPAPTSRPKDELARLHGMGPVPPLFELEGSGATPREGFPLPEGEGHGTIGDMSTTTTEPVYGPEFSIVFEETVSDEAKAEFLKALADLYRACGGLGLQYRIDEIEVPEGVEVGL